MYRLTSVGGGIERKVEVHKRRRDRDLVDLLTLRGILIAVLARRWQRLVCSDCWLDQVGRLCVSQIRVQRIYQQEEILDQGYRLRNVYLPAV